jgi:simple sugar transport system substrate-binding protein
MDLGVPGYNKIKLVGRVIYGNAWIDISRDNMNQYPF